MSETKTENNGLTLPLVPLRDIVVYPKMTVNLDIGRKDSADAVRLASRGDRYIVTALERQGDPSGDDVYLTGTVVKISQMLQLPGGLVRVLGAMADGDGMGLGLLPRRGVLRGAVLQRSAFVGLFLFAAVLLRLAFVQAPGQQLFQASQAQLAGQQRLLRSRHAPLLVGHHARLQRLPSRYQLLLKS